MRFRFCGDSSCPDWILAEINTLSRLSSIKLKLLAQVVAQGLLNPPIDVVKAEKLVSDSKLDPDVDLKACIACLSYIITSTVQFNCDHSALYSELQQLGLPPEHSTSIMRMLVDVRDNLARKLRSSSLKVNELQQVCASLNQATGNVELCLRIDSVDMSVTLTPYTANVLLENLRQAKAMMVDLVNSAYNYP